MPDTIVISGIGIISNLGLDVDTFWKNCLVGTSIVKPIPHKWQFYAKYNSDIWSPLDNIDFSTLGFNQVDLLQRDPVSLLAIASASQALSDANVKTTLVNPKKNQYTIDDIPSNKISVIIGTGVGGAKTFLEGHTHQVLNNYKKQYNPEKNAELLPCASRMNPFSVSMLMPNSVSASIGIRFSLTGQNHTVTQACASGSNAIGSAYKAIKTGVADYAICGGTEYLYDDYGVIYRGFDIARTLAKPHENIAQSNRPFDTDSSGFLYAQGGSAIFFIERKETALQRGATIYAEIVGFGETFDAYSMMSINQEHTQIPQAIYQALDEASIPSSSISYINTHGTGTKTNDTAEAAIISNIYGDKPIINSSKSLLGHTIGASGAFEAAICALSIRDQTVHLSKNLDNPILPLNFAKKTTTHPVQYAISHSFAFGGHNAILVFKKP